MLKSARHHYYLLFSSTRGNLSCKKSFLVWCEILRLFVNAWTADGWQLFRQQYAEFATTISNVIISDKKDFFWFFIAF